MKPETRTKFVVDPTRVALQAALVSGLIQDQGDKYYRAPYRLPVSIRGFAESVCYFVEQTPQGEVPVEIPSSVLMYLPDLLQR